MDKSTLIKQRKEFFENILTMLRMSPGRMDELLGQDKYYLPFDEHSSFEQSLTGDLVINVKGKFADTPFQFAYTIWQYGKTLTLGLALYTENLEGAFSSDDNGEIYTLWGKHNDPHMSKLYGNLYYNWSFEVTDLYDNYQEQEFFIIGIRHMHFRVLRMIYEECIRQQQRQKQDDDYYKNRNQPLNDIMNGNERE